MKALLEWESRAILGEESWSFTAQGDAEAVLTRLRSEVDIEGSARGIPLRLRWYKSDKEFVGQVRHDRIELVRRVNPIMWAFGNRQYFFSGRITSHPRGTVIEGTYKILGWSRVVFLVVLNLFLLFSVGFLVGIGMQVIERSGGGSAFGMKGLIHGIGFLFLSTAVFLSVFGFLRYLDRGNREAIHGFLARITSDIPSNTRIGI